MQQTPINEVLNREVLDFMRPGYQRVVEVGSSSGVLARAYREQNPGAHYTGIEIDAAYAEASRRYCNDVILGNVEKLADDTLNSLAGANCWVFADALEHLYDPWRLLRRIREHAPQGGEIIACIPNAQHWGVQSALNAGQFFYQDSGLLDRTHIRWLTRLTILDLFSSSGYRIEQMISRVMHQPPLPVQTAIMDLARATGVDPQQALADAIPFQYVMRAVAV